MLTPLYYTGGELWPVVYNSHTRWFPFKTKALKCQILGTFNFFNPNQ